MSLDSHPLRLTADLTDLLRTGLTSEPDAVAIVSLQDQLTWQELDDASTRLATGYLALGLHPGDRVASLMPNRIALVVHYLACFKVGLVATPLNYRYATPEIDHALDVSGASVLVAHVERAADVAATELGERLDVGVVTYGDPDGHTWRATSTLEALMETSAEPGALPPVNRHAPAAIFFTSGSTGPAKGVTHSLETLGWMAAGAAAAFELTADDTFLPASSISHIGSLLWTLAAFSVGAKVVHAQLYDAGEVLALLRAHRPTVMAMIPAALTALVRDHDACTEDFESLRVCRSGSDKVSLELETEFSHLVGFLIDEGYGMTEVGLATLNPPSGDIRRGSIGIPVPGVDIELRGDDNAEVPTGEVGRVWIRTNGHTIGYWQNPGATAQVMRDGWLDSGDLAHADQDGYLWFFGRKKQIMVHDGSNISPFEVEGALAEHPAVALVGVIGIRDEVHGENVRAYVTIVNGVDRPAAQELIDFARERVGYKAPEEIVFLDEMPLNPTGKLDRVGLKRMAERHLNPHSVVSATAHGGTEREG